MRKLIFVAVDSPGRGRIIRAEKAPTLSDHGPAGNALYCIGPFRTIRGARFCVDTLRGVIYQTVSEWEKYAPRAVAR